MKSAIKPLTLHRLSIGLLTTVLLLCACVIVGQQRDIQRFRAREVETQEKLVQSQAEIAKCQADLPADYYRRAWKPWKYQGLVSDELPVD